MWAVNYNKCVNSGGSHNDVTPCPCQLTMLMGCQYFRKCIENKVIIMKCPQQIAEHIFLVYFCSMQGGRGCRNEMLCVNGAMC